MKVTAKRKFSLRLLIVLAVICFVFSMVFFPGAVFEASKTGVRAWWDIVFPALLPFFISSELLMNYGVIRFMGVLLEPVMRPVFNLPGAGSFVMAIGYTSGFPISASLAARLRKDKLCTRLEAERLMCFTNNASPLFMLVAVGVGMFNSPRLGILIALAHYTANLLLGFLLRFYKTDDPESGIVVIQRGNLLHRAVSEMQKALHANPHRFGKMLGEAISSSINKLLVIGGFVIIFSVIIRIFSLTGLMSIIYNIIGLAAAPLGFTKSTVQSLSYGFFEITLGTKAASEAIAPLAEKVIAAGMILGWSGVSVVAQVSAMISETDLKMGLFICSRLLHSIITGVICFLLLRNQSIQAWLAKPAAIGLPFSQETCSWLANLFYFSRLCLLAILAWMLLAILVYLLRSFSVIYFNIKQ